MNPLLYNPPSFQDRVLVPVRPREEDKGLRGPQVGCVNSGKEGECSCGAEHSEQRLEVGLRSQASCGIFLR